MSRSSAYGIAGPQTTTENSTESSPVVMTENRAYNFAVRAGRGLGVIGVMELTTLTIQCCHSHQVELIKFLKS